MIPDDWHDFVVVGVVLVATVLLYALVDPLGRGPCQRLRALQQPHCVWRETARRIEADESEERFDGALRKIAKSQPELAPKGEKQKLKD
jgi:hypothetical protein